MFQCIGACLGFDLHQVLAVWAVRVPDLERPKSHFDVLRLSLGLKQTDLDLRANALPQLEH